VIRREEKREEKGREEEEEIYSRKEIRKVMRELKNGKGMAMEVDERCGNECGNMGKGEIGRMGLAVL